MAKSDRRHFPRQNEDATIQVLLRSDYFRDVKERCNLIPAKMCNQSQQGLYLEIDRDLQPGLNISIRMAAPQGHHPEAPYHVRDGLVIWSKKIDNNISHFGVGVKVLRKVVRADVLSSRFG